MDRLQAMSVFVGVVEAGGFSAASARLGLSRAGVSKSVRQLEDRLGTRLLNRTTRRVSTTESGRVFYARCKDILAEIAEAESVASRLTSEPKGLLRVNAPLSFGTLHLGPAVAAYCQRYPQVQVSLALNDRFVDVVAEGFDVVVRITQLEDSSLVARRVAPCRLQLCAAPAYLSQRGRPQVPQDLALHACLVYTNSPTGDSWSLTGPAGEETVRVNGPICADNGEVLRSAALAGLGITLQPSFIVGRDIATGRLEPVLTAYRPREIAVYAVFPTRRYLSAKVRTFVEFLHSHFDTLPDWVGAG